MRTRWWLLCLTALLALACRPPAEPYTADEGIVLGLGEAEGLEKLRTVLKQATAPQVTPQSVDVTSEYYFYQALDIAMYGRGFVSKKVYFKEIDRVEMWESRATRTSGSCARTTRRSISSSGAARSTPSCSPTW